MKEDNLVHAYNYFGLHPFSKPEKRTVKDAISYLKKIYPELEISRARFSEREGVLYASLAPYKNMGMLKRKGKNSR